MMKQLNLFMMTSVNDVIVFELTREEERPCLTICCKRLFKLSINVFQNVYI